MKSYIAA
jgi:hypothetical protein